VTTEPVPIRDAATVVLLRDGAAGLEVFLQRRVASMVFAAGMTVFPGGARDPEDPDLVATAVRETHEETGVRLDPSALRPWSRWVTPEGEVRRYDTWFCVVGLPDGEDPAARGGEMDEVAWLAPADALERLARKELRMLPPTAVTLRELTRHASVGSVLEATRDRPIEPIMPRLFVDEQGVGVELPDGEVLRP